MYVTETNYTACKFTLSHFFIRPLFFVSSDEECLGLFSRLAPTLLLNDFEERPFMPAAQFEKEIEGRGMSSVLISK